MRLTYSYAFISRATPTSYPTELFLLMLPRQWFCLLKGKQTHILGATMVVYVFVLIFVEYIHIAFKMSNHYTYPAVISCADGRTQVQRLFIYLAFDICEMWLIFRELTHWGRDKVDLSQMRFSNAFSWMKTYEFRLQFHWYLSSWQYSSLSPMIV